MVDIRITGTPEEVAEFVAFFRDTLDVIEESKPYPNRPPSKNVRVYIEAKMPDPHGGHIGQYLDVDGEPVHLLADPNMSKESAEAISDLVRAARKYLDRKTITVRELCENHEAQMPEVDGWFIDVLGERRYPVNSVAPFNATGTYQVIYRVPHSSRPLRSLLCDGDTVLSREG